MQKALFLGFVVAAGGCAGSDIVCGDGTTMVGNTCTGTGGSGSDPTTCGTGTHLAGTMCVPDAPGSTNASAPTVTKITPSDAGVFGGGLFTITGTNFAASNVTSLHVYFGDMANTNCEATVGAATATSIAGEVPPACDLNVVVTVQTNVGSATIPFHYDAILVADGDAGAGNPNGYGNLYMVDPFSQKAFDFGVMNDGALGYAVSGMAFDGMGQLWGVTTGNSQNDIGVSELVTIDPSTATVTYVGDAFDATTGYLVTDIKFSGTTLYAVGYDAAAVGQPQQLLLTIDPIDGSVTRVGNTAHSSFITGGLAIDANGGIFSATSGYPDSNLQYASTGEFDHVASNGAPTTGLTTAPYLDWGFGTPIRSLTYYNDVLLAVVDSGSYMKYATDTTMFPDVAGVQLMTLDPTQPGYDANSLASEEILTPLFEMPSQSYPGSQSHASAIVVPPTTFNLIARLAPKKWMDLGTTVRNTGSTNSMALKGGALLRDKVTHALVQAAN